MKNTEKLGGILLFIPIVYFLMTYSDMSDEVALHFDLYGNADLYGSKNIIAVIPLIFIVVYFLIIFLKKFLNTKQLDDLFEVVQLMYVLIGYTVPIFIIANTAKVLINTTLIQVFILTILVCVIFIFIEIIKVLNIAKKLEKNIKK